MRASKQVLVGVAVGLALLGVALALGSRAGVLILPLDRPEGPMFWNLARVAGVTAYIALTGTVALGLLASTGALDVWIARARSLELHRFLSSVTLALLAAHGIAFLGDAQARFDLLDLLVPFLAPYRPLAVGIAVVASYLLVVVHLSAILRARLGQRAFRALHALSFPAFWLVSAHGILAGSDAHRPGMRAVYLVCAGLVIALTLYRFAARSAYVSDPRCGPADSRAKGMSPPRRL
ncbi:MAG: hypothetical protein U0359_23165 [Byssovorax sp.]